MRTTLTLDPDVARLLEEEVHRRRTSLKDVVNTAIRKGLSGRARAKPTPYRLKPHAAVLQPGHDPSALNRLADQLGTEAVDRKLRRGRT